ncbi:MAG: hypothetical protein HRU25_03695 [Psychrobium sp.]|nr:hypothetical protein [Psychrobium sp.]
MEIQSAFNSGMAGFKAATERADQSAQNLASVYTQNPAASNAEVDEQSSQTGTDSSSSHPISQELVNLKVAEHQAMASAKVITTADEVLGSLIDTRV